MKKSQDESWSEERCRVDPEEGRQKRRRQGEPENEGTTRDLNEGVNRKTELNCVPNGTQWREVADRQERRQREVAPTREPQHKTRSFCI